MNGFAGGAMLGAVLWNLIPSGLETGSGGTAWGLMLCLLLAAAGELLPGGDSGEKRRTGMMLAALVLHNIPEGMAVGAVAGKEPGIMIGIAVQNIPDGAVAALLLAAVGMEKKRAFVAGVITGLVEPAAALAAMGLRERWIALEPGMMGFAAGAMIYVILRELTPRMEENWRGMAWFSVGFGLILALG